MSSLFVLELVIDEEHRKRGAFARLTRN